MNELWLIQALKDAADLTKSETVTVVDRETDLFYCIKLKSVRLAFVKIFEDLIYAVIHKAQMMKEARSTSTFV